jgi:hypothetical protein
VSKFVEGHNFEGINIFWGSTFVGGQNLGFFQQIGVNIFEGQQFWAERRPRSE